MSLKIYMDHISQPSRAVWTLCKLGNIPHELIQIRVNKKMNLTEDYKKLNPFMQIPTIDDEGFILYESHAIMTYLCQKFKLESFYPSDHKEKAKINSYLHWHHLNTRSCVKLLQIANKDYVHYEVNHNKEKEEKHVASVLKSIEEIFLKDHDYLCQRNEVSIADISAACEIIGLDMIDYDLSPYQKLKSWLERVHSLPEMKESHEIYFKLAEISKKRRREKQNSFK